MEFPGTVSREQCQPQVKQLHWEHDVADLCSSYVTYYVDRRYVVCFLKF